MTISETDLFSELYGACWKTALSVIAPEYRTEAAGTSCTFRPTTRSEYVRARTLGGERHVVEAFLSGLRPGDIVWDIGACIGTYACFAADRANHVVAFEPEPTNRARLRKNLAANAPGDRWTVAATALASGGALERLASEFVEAGGGHHYLVSGETAGGTPVEVTSGDELAGTAYPDPSVLKLDVQGAEGVVLDGLEETLPDVRSVFVEIHEEKCRRYDTDPADVERALECAGLTTERLGRPSSNRDGVYFLRAVRE